MAEQTIVGVDFSGGKRGVPWITTAILEGTSLVLKSCEDIGREDLKKRLRKLPANAVAAMDFPFGVPLQFALELDPNGSDMSDLWRVAAGDDMEYSRFEKLRDCFVQRQGNRELLRCGDIYFDGPLSPLKKGGPNMLPMTFRGMEMLSHLWESKTPRFRVPPLSYVGRDGPTLLETMPGVLLRTFCLPHEKYKGAKNDDDSRKNRKVILNGLEEKSGLTIKIPKTEYDKCLDYHDCLDSLVAAVGAALWVKRPEKYLQPHPSRTVGESSAYPKRNRRISPGVENMAEINAARLEGWLYAPKK